MKKGLIVVLMFIYCMGYSQKNLNGKYITNFSALGFFGTSITFKENQRFEYRYAGDLMSDIGVGTFSVTKEYVVFVFEEESLETSRDNSYEYNDSLRIVWASLLDNPAKISRPKKYKISRNKLFEVHRVTGKTVKREQGFSRRKKFLFFGEHYMTKRKHYLKKV